MSKPVQKGDLAAFMAEVEKKFNAVKADVNVVKADVNVVKADVNVVKANVDKNTVDVNAVKADVADVDDKVKAAMIGRGNHTVGITTAAQYYSYECHERRFMHARDMFELYCATNVQIDDVLTKLAVLLGKRIDCQKWFQQQFKNIKSEEDLQQAMFATMKLIAKAASNAAAASHAAAASLQVVDTHETLFREINGRPDLTFASSAVDPSSVSVFTSVAYAELKAPKIAMSVGSVIGQAMWYGNSAARYVNHAVPVMLTNGKAALFLLSSLGDNAVPKCMYVEPVGFQLRDVCAFVIAAQRTLVDLVPSNVLECARQVHPNGVPIGAAGIGAVCRAVVWSSGDQLARPFMLKYVTSNDDKAVRAVQTLMHSAEILRALHKCQGANEVVLPEVVSAWDAGVVLETCFGKRVHTDTELTRKQLNDFCATLAVVHNAGYFHGDIDLRNMILFDGRGMLIDFGVAGRIGQQRYPFASLLTLPLAMLVAASKSGKCEPSAEPATASYDLEELLNAVLRQVWHVNGNPLAWNETDMQKSAKTNAARFGWIRDTLARKAVALLPRANARLDLNERKALYREFADELYNISSLGPRSSVAAAVTTPPRHEAMPQAVRRKVAPRARSVVRASTARASMADAPTADASTAHASTGQSKRKFEPTPHSDEDEPKPSSKKFEDDDEDEIVSQPQQLAKKSKKKPLKRILKK